MKFCVIRDCENAEEEAISKPRSANKKFTTAIPFGAKCHFSDSFHCSSVVPNSVICQDL